jgi:flagellar protein FliL
MADNNVDNEEMGAPKKKGKLLFIVAVLLLLILGTGGYFGAAYFMHLPPFSPPGPTPEEIAAQKASEEKERQLLQREIYVPFENTFTYTIKSDRRIHTGQVQVVLAVVGEENEALARKHLTLMNSVIFEKLSAQTYEALLMPSGRQRLKRELLDSVRAKMSEITKNPVVDQILFTSFVLQ